MADDHEQYWADYSNLQHVKHDLIRRYLGGWFAKLGTWAGRVLYVDTHAGRGMHLNGELGSPLVALNTLLDHRYRAALLAKSEFRFAFIERDAENCAALKVELAKLKLPDRVHVDALNRDSYQTLDDLVTAAERDKARLAPAFIFVDPFGFKVPGKLLRRLFKAGRTELFINVIWRELDLAIGHARKGHDGFIKTLTDIFDGDGWKQIVSENFDERADLATNAFAEMVGAKWPTYIRMLGDNQATRYLLLHLSDHDQGRDLMKDCIWAVCPDGGFYARKTTDLTQQVLIEPEPDLTPLRGWLLEQLKAGPRRWSALEEALRPELWRMPQLNKVIRACRKEEIIEGSDYEGKFTRSSDPLLALCEDQEN